MSTGGGRLTLVLPGYAQGATPLADTPLAPALQRLLARATWSPTSRSSQAALLAALGVGADVSLAALLARAELGLDEPGWVRADPVHFRADAKLVLLLAPDADAISTQEAAALCAELTARLPEFTWRQGSDPRRWYARMPDLQATPVLGPAWLHGRSLTPFFPQDAAHRRWRQCMTETQMVMHAAATNLARESRGATPLNALWIWGAGAAAQAGTTDLALCVGRDLLLRGAAQTATVAWQATASAEVIVPALASGDVLLAAGTLFGAHPAATDSVVDEANGLAALAWSLLGTGAAREVLIVGEGLCGRVGRDARWRFWQRRTRGAFGDPYTAVPA